MIYALIVAAGKGTRMNSELPKQLMHFGSSTVLETSIRKFYEHKHIDALAVVSPADGTYEEEYKKIIAAVCDYNTNKRILLCRGGKERSDSVLNGLKAIAEDAAGRGVRTDEVIVLIHDAARPGVDADIINRNIDALSEFKAVTTVIPAVDSIRVRTEAAIGEKGKKIEANTALKEATKYPIIKSTVLERKNVFCVQTPQSFILSDILQAYDKAIADGYLGTDDASVAEHAGIEVALVEGSRANNKITTREDITMTVRTGMGYDVHKLVPGRDLILCGTPVPYEMGLLGHSDADVATHALMDALLGAAGLGDIGRHFPDTDDKYKGANSLMLLAKVRELLADYTINNVDVTIVAQAPKLAPYNRQMVENIATTLGIDESQVNIKATTTEGLGFTGTKEGIAAFASCAIER